MTLPASPPIDWDTLLGAARDMLTLAYAPYSNYPVGAAGMVEDGRVVRGCNVENAAYGVALCAECGLISQLAATGGGRLVALACVQRDGRAVMPCGRCRQLLVEHARSDCLVATAEGRPVTVTELVPLAFGVSDLKA